MAIEVTQDFKKSIDEAKSKSEDIPDPVDFLTDASNAVAKVEEVPKEFLRLVCVGQDTKTLIDEAKSKDEDVATAIIQVNKAVNTAFFHAHSYITKCYEVADYICHEEKNVIKAIEEENVVKFKDFLVEVLHRSSKCQKDISTLLHFIEKEKQKITEEKLKAEAKKDVKISTTKDGGIFGVIRSAADTIASAMWGSSQYHYYEKVIKAFEELREVLANIEHTLENVNSIRQLLIDNNLSDMTDKTYKLDSGFVKRSIIKKMGTVKSQSELLKEYCQPFKDAKYLKDYIYKQLNRQ